MAIAGAYKSWLILASLVVVLGHSRGLQIMACLGLIGGGYFVRVGVLTLLILASVLFV